MQTWQRPTVIDAMLLGVGVVGLEAEGHKAEREEQEGVSGGRMGWEGMIGSGCSAGGL